MSCKINDCPCSYTNQNGDKCIHHGKCCECIEHHRSKLELPGCYFSKEDEKTYNRTINFYVEQQTLRKEVK